MNKSLIMNLMKEHKHYVFIQVIIWALAALFDVVLNTDGVIVNIVYVFSGAMLVSFFVLYFMNDYVDKDKYFSYAALPMSKGMLWLHYVVSGLLLIYVPLIIETVITWAINFDVEPVYFISLLLVGVFYFFQAILCSTISGNKLGRSILFLGMSFIPYIFYAIFLSYLSLLVPAGSFEFSENVACLLCPLFATLFETWNIGIDLLGRSFISTSGYLPILVYSAVMAVLSRYTFIHYPIKNDHKLIVYPKLNEVIKYILVVTMALVFASGIIVILPQLVSNYGFTEILKLGVLLVAVTLLVGLFIELVLKQDHLYKHVAFYCLASAVLFAGMFVLARNNYVSYASKVLNNADYVSFARESLCMEMKCNELNKKEEIMKMLVDYDSLTYQKSDSTQSYQLEFSKQDEDGDMSDYFSVFLDEEHVDQYEDTIKNIVINASKGPEFVEAKNGMALLDTKEMQELTETQMKNHHIVEEYVFYSTKGNDSDYGDYDITVSTAAIKRFELFKKLMDSKTFEKALSNTLHTSDYSIDQCNVTSIKGNIVNMEMKVYDDTNSYHYKAVMDLKNNNVSFEVMNHD